MTGVYFQNQYTDQQLKRYPRQNQTNIDPPPVIGKNKGQPENEYYSNQSLKSLHILNLYTEDKGINVKNECRNIETLLVSFVNLRLV